MASKRLCTSCTNSIFCKTWGQWRCLKHSRRFSMYGLMMPSKCTDYAKEDKGFERPDCQCKDCLRNPIIYDETLYEE